MYGRRVFEALAILVGATFCFTSFVGRAWAQADPTMRVWTLDPDTLFEEATLSGPHSDEGNGWLNLDVTHVEGRLPENLVYSESFGEDEIPMYYDGPEFYLRVNYTGNTPITIRVHVEGWQGLELPRQARVPVSRGTGVVVTIPIDGMGNFDFLKKVEFWFEYEWGEETALHVELDQLELESAWDGLYLIDDFGDVPTSVAGEAPTAPATRVALNQNAPNPFNPRTTIPFQVAETGTVNLAVYDVSGRKVQTLVNGNFSAGSHAVSWDGVDANGGPVPSGVYTARLEAGGTTQTRKMLLVK